MAGLFDCHETVAQSICFHLLPSTLITNPSLIEVKPCSLQPIAERNQRCTLIIIGTALAKTFRAGTGPQ